MAQNDGSSSRVPPVRPTVALPPRSSMETLFSGSGASPGPMTLVSNFFSDNDPDSECRSFSQLLAGAMACPATVPAAVRHRFQTPTESSAPRGKESVVGDMDFRFKQSPPTALMVTQPAMFTIPPGLSPASLLDSPGFFPPVQGAFGLSHQQALAHVSSQVAQAQPQLHIPAEYPSLSSGPPPSSSHLQSLTSNKNSHQQMAPPVADPNIVQESSDISLPDQKSQPAITVDKPADDGYNWRKYGQKQVKGSECPRSYYKCTHANCPVKKKVERSQDGQVTEIIYKGQHNHRPPQPIKRSKDAENSNGTYNLHGNSNQESKEGLPSHSLSNQEFSQATPEKVSGSSESEEVGDTDAGVDVRDDDEPESKRRNLEARSSEQASSHRTVTEPRIIVQTTSEVDLLDDGYRWRKYGQKVVKGNPYPRSYYKCTSQGCNVRKHVERAASDAKAVITTYEGKHNHDVPAAKNSSHATANMVSQLRSQNSVPDNQSMARRPEFKSNGQQPVASLRFKEEQIT